MQNPLLSVCIPVYNQSSLLRSCLTELMKYKGDDIEIVVNDNCSEESIPEVIASFADKRIKYFRNDKNLGHDLNIIQSFRNSKAKHSFLLRTKDLLFSDGIVRIIDRIKVNPYLSYLTGNAIYEDGKNRFSYSKVHHSIGKEALSAHMKLYIHPSGSLYATHLIDLNRAEDFLNQKFPDKFGFIVHNLFRLELAFKGDFELITTDIWQYTNTSSATIKATNILPANESPYSSRLQYRRFEAEMEWAINVASEDKVFDILKWLSDRYLYMVTWQFRDINNDFQLHSHYNSHKVNFSIGDEREKFKIISNSLADKNIIDLKLKNEYIDYLNKIILKNKKYLINYYLFNPIKHQLATHFRKSKLIYKAYRSLRNKLIGVNSL